MRHHAKCCADRSNRCRDIVIFGFFRMSAAAILDFVNFKFVMDHTVTRVELCHMPNFVEIAETAADDFSIFQKGGRRHLKFLKWDAS